MHGLGTSEMLPAKEICKELRPAEEGSKFVIFRVSNAGKASVFSGVGVAEKESGSDHS